MWNSKQLNHFYESAFIIAKKVTKSMKQSLQSICVLCKTTLPVSVSIFLKLSFKQYVGLKEGKAAV